MKCPSCGYEASVEDFLDTWVMWNPDENEVGTMCPKCLVEIE